MNNRFELNDILDSKNYLGVDYGTYKSMAAVKEEGSLRNPEILSLTNSIGLRSLFWASDDGSSIKLCDEVERNNYIVNDPSSVVSSPKMLLKEENLDKPVKVGKNEFTAEFINEKVLRKVFENTSKALQKRLVKDIDGICVGVPVVFGSRSRYMLLSLLERIGYTNVQLLSEPMAAAEYIAHRTKARLEEPTMIFDIGAGTFDLTLMEKNRNRTPESPEPFNIVDSDGCEIAGNSFDRVMLDLIIRNADKKVSLPKENTNEYRMLINQAREFKEQILSDTAVNNDAYQKAKGEKIPNHYYAGESLQFRSSVSIDEFEKAILPIVELNVQRAVKMVEKKGLQGKQFYIILVGGSSQIPVIGSCIEKAFPWVNERNIILFEPDRCVAMGCALFAEQPAFIRKVSFSYGFEAHTASNEVGVDICIPSSVELPYSYSTTYSTLLDKQTGAVFNLYEIESGNKGEFVPLSNARYANYSYTHQFDKPAPRGTELNVEVSLSGDGVITLKITDSFGKVSTGNINVGLGRSGGFEYE